MPRISITDKSGNPLSIPVRVEGPRITLLAELQKAGEDMIGQCGGHGICGRCKVTLKSGRLHDVQEPMMPLPDDEYLACCVVPDLSDDVDVTLDRANFKPRSQ